MTATKLFVAIPIMGAPETAHTASLSKLITAAPAAGVSLVVKFLTGESLITRARNTLVHQFLKTDCSHMLFIDSDIVFNADDVFRMLAKNKPVLGAVYPKKNLNVEGIRAAALRGETDIMRWGATMVVNFPPDSEGVEMVDGCVRVMDAPTGFLMVQRQVFERMATAMPDLLTVSDADATRGEPVFGFFLEMLEPGTKRHLSEDYAFSRRCQALGIEVLVDCNVKLSHVGRYTFTGDMGILFEDEEPGPAAMSGADADSENLDVMANPTGWVEQLHIQRYEWAAAHLADAFTDQRLESVANAACGTGYGSPILGRALGCVFVDGFDLDERALETARKRHPEYCFSKRDVTDPFINNYDALVCLETIEHLDDPWTFLSHLTVQHLVLSTPIIPTKHRNPFHKWDFTKAEIDAALRTAGYTIVDYQQQCNDVGLWYATRQ